METASQPKTQVQYEPKPSLRDRYGDPAPSGKTVVITADDTALATELLAKSSEMVIQFLRDPSLLTINYEELKNNANRVFIGRRQGEPHGVCLAFKHGDHIFIGWSKHNTGQDITDDDIAAFSAEWRAKMADAGLIVEEDDAETAKVIDGLLKMMAVEYVEPTPVEPLPFSKRDARRVAILRALTDDIIIKGKGYYTRDGNPLPNDIQELLKRVIRLAKLKFGTSTIRNLVPEMHKLG